MNNIIRLTKIYLKTSFNVFIASNENNKKKSKKSLKGLLFIILFLYLIGVMGFASYGIINMLNEAGQPALFLGVLFLAISGLALITSIMNGMNLFYFSKDLDYILPLPIKPTEIVAAKLNSLLITEYYTVFLLGIAPIIIYGVVTGAGILFYLYSLLIFLVFPILPTLIALILIMLVMQFGKLVKNKDAFQVITSILLIGFVFFIEFMIPQEDISMEETVAMFTKFNGMVDMISNYFITLPDSINALVDYNSLSGLISLGKVLLITGLSYVLFILVAKKIYLKGAVGAKYGGTKTKKGSLSFKQNNVCVSYIKKEFTMLVKNSVYFIQCILPSLIFPLVIAGIFFFKINESINSDIDLAEMQLELSSLNTIGLCIILGINIFFIFMNYIAITAISRDGENATFMKYIPISYRKQCDYKIAPCVIMNIFTTIFTDIVLVLLGKSNILYLGAITIISILFSIFYSYLCIIVDLKRPKLKWDTEYAVVKQNMNMLFSMGFCLAFAILIIAVGVFFSEQTVLIPIIILFSAPAIGIIFVRKYIKKNEVALFERIG